MLIVSIPTACSFEEEENNTELRSANVTHFYAHLLRKSWKIFTRWKVKLKTHLCRSTAVESHKSRRKLAKLKSIALNHLKVTVSKLKLGKNTF